MARMARTKTNIQIMNEGQPSVETKRYNHVVPEVTSSSAGLNPFAGDLSQAFSNFFQGAQSAVMTLKEGDMIRQKQTIEWDQKAAQTNAMNTMVENPGLHMSDFQKDPTFGMEQNKSDAYGIAYKQSLGSHLSGRSWGQFQEHMKYQPPENFNAEADKWWNDQYGSGTGDPIVDQAMASSWTQNLETARMTAFGESVKRSKQTQLDTVNKDAFTAISSDKFGAGDYERLVASLRGINPSMTDGTARSAALAALSQASIAQGGLAQQRFLKFLDTPFGEDNKSLSERFPMQMETLKAQAWAKAKQWSTREGALAVTAVDSAFDVLVAETPDEDALMKKIMNGFVGKELPRLSNMPGVPYSSLAALKTKVNEKVNELSKYHLAVNNVGQSVMDNKPTAWMSQEVAQKYGFDWIERNADFASSGSLNDATDAGRALKFFYGNYGVNGIDERTTDYFAAAINSENPVTAAHAARALNLADPTGKLAAAMFEKSPEAAAKFAAAHSLGLYGKGSMEQVMASLSSQEFRDTYQALGQKNALIDDLVPGKSGDDQKKKYEERYGKAAVAEDIQEALGITYIGTPDISQGAHDQFEKALHYAAAVHRTNPSLGTDWDDIKETAVKIAAPNIVLENGVLRPKTGAKQATRNNIGIVTSVPIGNAVTNPSTGEVENTAQTLREDVNQIEEGVVGLNLDDDKLYVDNAEFLKGTNGYLVKYKDTTMPVTLGVGTQYEADALFLASEVKSRDDMGDWETTTKAEHLSWWRDVWDDDGAEKFVTEDDNGNTVIKFTGDMDADRILAEIFLPKGVGLFPQRNPDGSIVGYMLTVAPRFAGQTDLNDQELLNRAAGSHIYKGDPMNETEAFYP